MHMPTLTMDGPRSFSNGILSPDTLYSGTYDLLSTYRIRGSATTKGRTHIQSKVEQGRAMLESVI